MVDIQTTSFVAEKWLVFPKYFIFFKSTVSNLWCSSFLELATTWNILGAKWLLEKTLISCPIRKDREEFCAQVLSLRVMSTKVTAPDKFLNARLV